jgi:Putative DNA-binding domain
VSLPRLQAAFQRYLLQGDTGIRDAVVGTNKVPVDIRLSIYGDGYKLRLIESLAATFPVLAELLGEADFSTLGARYVEAHDSTFASIRFYGDAMPDFLANAPDYAAAPILAELARWEWAMAAVFDAADAEPVDTSAVASVSPEDWSELRFSWSPSVQVLELQWNVPELWKAVTEGADRPDPALQPAGGSWLLWRRDLQIYFRPLATEEAAIIHASRTGRTFGELCDLLCSHVDEQEAPRHAAGFLRGWMESALIVSVDLPAPPPQE